ncbi:MAG: hypothetical protein JSU68_08380 [Phycisphaerales bacterium]|nr:MAG: hypothetical protein JSU68_08380 [Phycisphaerales bacterium]
MARLSESGCCDSNGNPAEKDPSPEHSHRGSCCDYCTSPCCTVQSVVHMPFDLDLHADPAQQNTHFLHAQPVSITLDDVWHPPRA